MQVFEKLRYTLNKTLIKKAQIAQKIFILEKS